MEEGTTPPIVPTAPPPPGPPLSPLPVGSPPSETFRQPSGTSHLFGLSVRGMLAILIVGTICWLSGKGTTVAEPLYSMGTMALGFYFGQAMTKTKS